ncbi:MAG TPA: ABC transporter permease [Candidatus Nanoarchaeia archaeon]|nr:ABC transporter permease [Candidatus Nanoarchaeia archaeon]
MKELSQYVQFSVRNLVRRGVRSWLTMLGIFIGIAAVVALVSLGQGLQRSIDEQFSQLGVDKLIVQPRGEFGPPGSSTTTAKLDEDDVGAVGRAKDVVRVAGYMLKPIRVEFHEQVRYFLALGLPTDEQKHLVDDFANLQIAQGRDIRPNDGRKAVLGHQFLDANLFSPNVRVGDRLLINDAEFEAVGFYGVIGNTGDDRNVVMPLDTLRELTGAGEEVSAIVAQSGRNADPEAVAVAIEKALRKHRDVEEGKEDFSVQTSTELIESFGNVILIVQAFLIGVAAISLVVGGIGIMNTMYTAVLERTREIGVMKAIGATNADIMKIFLIESGLLGIAGGGVGIIIGILVSKGIEVILAATGNSFLKIYFPWYLIVGALVFAAGVGMLSGLLPAVQAAKQQPVDALRYE